MLSIRVVGALGREQETTEATDDDDADDDDVLTVLVLVPVVHESAIRRPAVGSREARIIEGDSTARTTMVGWLVDCCQGK